MGDFPVRRRQNEEARSGLGEFAGASHSRLKSPNLTDLSDDLQDLIFKMGSSSTVDPLIDVQNLEKTFTTPTGDVVAVDGVSLQIHAGEVFGLLGANGAGKTTTLRMMLGLLSPTAGSARIAGFDVANDRFRQRVAVSMADASRIDVLLR
jgi:ABC-type glutathione transport system ATPase component